MLLKLIDFYRLYREWCNEFQIKFNDIIQTRIKELK